MPDDDTSQSSESAVHRRMIKEILQETVVLGTCGFSYGFVWPYLATQLHLLALTKYAITLIHQLIIIGIMLQTLFSIGNLVLSSIR